MKEQYRWVWVCTSGNVWEDQSFEVIVMDLGGGRRLWRHKAGSIISQKKIHERDLLHEKPANSDLHKTA